MSPCSSINISSKVKVTKSAKRRVAGVHATSVCLIAESQGTTSSMISFSGRSHQPEFLQWRNQRDFPGVTVDTMGWREVIDMGCHGCHHASRLPDSVSMLQQILLVLLPREKQPSMRTCQRHSLRLSADSSGLTENAGQESDGRTL